MGRDINLNKPDPPSVIHENIKVVANLEQEFLRSRSLLDRGIDAVADFTGSMKFVLAHLCWFVAWFSFNALPGLPHFDPYPFAMLSSIVSCEAVILSALVLMKQNRMGQHADEREHLHLQINLLAEKEITKVIQTLQVMCQHMGIEEAAADPQVQELSQDTAVDHLASELRQKIQEVSQT